jgi:hypothetical protein
MQTKIGQVFILPVLEVTPIHVPEIGDYKTVSIA